MTDLLDPDVQAILNGANPGVMSTQQGDGTILSTVVWVGFEDGELSVNSSVGRRWPANLAHDQHATLVVVDAQNFYTFVEIRGTVTSTLDGAIADIHKLSHKYLGSDYPWLQPGEQRIKFTFTPERVRLNKQ